MGYNTDFVGKFTLDKPLTTEQARFLMLFNETRRMKRNPKLVGKDPVREAAMIPIGIDGGNFVGGTGFGGQDHDKSVIDDNGHPDNQPSLWCQWTPGNKYGKRYGYDHLFLSDDSDEEKVHTIVWDAGEKFYYYVEWIKYIIENFLKPWGRILNGSVEYRGESFGDHGYINVKDNVVSNDNTSQ